MAAAFDVFLCHHNRDKPAVKEIGRRLRDRNLSVWLDEWELQPGLPWQKAMGEAVLSARAVAVFLGSNGAGSWQTQEAELALDRAARETVPVIPVLLPEAPADLPERDFLPPFLPLRTWVDLRPGVTEEGLDRLVWGITGERPEEDLPSDGGFTDTSATPTPPGFPRLHNLPFPTLGDRFKGRREHLERLAGDLEADPAAAITQPQALSGLGGVGKTRLAVEYAWRSGGRYSAVFFVRADSRVRLQQGLAELAGADLLGLGLEGVAEPDVVRAVLGRLRQDPGWLLILDNVDDVEAQKAVRELLPLTGGHVLVTSRLAVWPGGVRTRDVDRLEREDSVALLLDSTEGGRQAREDDAEMADAIAEELGDFPLALELAAAYVCARGMALADYLEDWQARRQQVLAWHDEAATDYPRAIAVTWSHSFEQLGTPARALLRLLAHLAPDPLPPGLVESAAGSLGEGVRLLEEEGGEGGEGAEDGKEPGVGAAEDPGEPPGAEVDPLAALAELNRYSLTERREGKLAVHRMVQEVVRQRIPERQRPAWAERAVRLLLDFAPGDPEDVRTWPVWDPLRPHAARVIELAQAESITLPTSALMNGLGLLLLNKSLLSEAEPLFRRALQIREEELDEEHPDIATSLNNLAQLLQATNRLQEAESLMRRALDIVTDAFGEQHPRVAAQLNNLARLLQDTNLLQEAQPLMRRALDIVTDAFGEQHPRVAAQLNNLASLLYDTKRFQEAEPLMRRALDIDTHAFGEQHPRVAVVLNNLAQLLKATDRLQDAEPLMRKALDIDTHAFGEQHPRIAVDLNNLAQLLQATDRLQDAEPLMRRALAIDTQALGEQHPNVAIRLNNLAALLYNTDRLQEAEPLMLKALEILLDFTRRHGHEHPRLQTATTNYRLLLSNLGKTEEEIDVALADLRREGEDRAE